MLRKLSLIRPLVREEQLNSCRLLTGLISRHPVDINGDQKYTFNVKIVVKHMSLVMLEV